MLLPLRVGCCVGMAYALFVGNVIGTYVSPQKQVQLQLSAMHGFCCLQALGHVLTNCGELPVKAYARTGEKALYRP